MFRNNNNDNWEAQLRFDKAATRNIRELHEKVTSLAKELGYEYKSRAVKKNKYKNWDLNEYARMTEQPHEEAVLEWYWEKREPQIIQFGKNREKIIKEFEKYKYSAPKKSSKKKLK